MMHSLIIETKDEKELGLFRLKQTKDVFRERTQKFSLDGSSDKELGKSVMETENMYLRMDLSKADWHTYEDCTEHRKRSILSNSH